MDDRRGKQEPGEPAARLPGPPRSGALLEALVRALPDLVWLKDPEGVYLACNARFEQFLGASEAEIVGRTDADFLPREVADFFRRNDRAAAEAGGPVANEEEITFASDGHRETLETVKTPLFDDDGRLVGVLGVGRDITARKAAERFLSLQSHVLGLIASGAPLQETLDELTRGVEEHAPGTLASILVLDREKRFLVHGSAPSLPESYTKAIEPLAVGEGQGACGTAAFRRASVLVEDVSTDPLFAPFRELAVSHGLRACWSNPILGGDRGILGAIALYFRGPFQPTLLLRRLVELAADAAAVAITRDREERALRERDTLLHEMSATAHIGGWVFDPATGKGAWTDEVARIHDVDPALGTSAVFGLTFFTGASRQRIEEAVKEAIEQGTPYDLELEMVTALGNRKTVRTVGLPVVREGRVVEVRGTMQDVTERRRVERSRRETAERLQLFIENAPAGIAMLDREMRYVFVSRRWLQDYRLGPRDIVGLTHYEVFPDIPERWKEIHRRCLAGATESCEEDPFPRADGTLDWVKWEIRPWHDEDGAVGGVLVMSEVVTARKEAEDARARLQEQLLQSQKMESIGRLAGGVAHDFNNMLAVIEGHAAFALEQVDASSSVHSDLVEIRTAARRSADLTRQLLAFARRQAAAPRPLDLNVTVSRMREMLARLIGEDIDFVFRPGTGLWPVHVDPAQVDQLLANLCVNARDAIAGVGHVVVETRNVAFDEETSVAHGGISPGSFVMLSVTDDGSGIGPEVREHLFEPFFTTKPVGRGTGLGLATVYGIVQQNGGFIDVESEAGRGASFRIYFPRFEGSLSEPGEAPAEEMPLGAGETILLVEDEISMLRLGEAMLARLGYAVLATSSPLAALDLAGEYRGRIRLLLTDVVMPEMNGRELAEKMREVVPGLPCLFMSGYTADVIAHRGLLDEGVRLLQKPFSPHELAVQVKKALTGTPPRSTAFSLEVATVTAAKPAKPAARRPILFVDDEEGLGRLMKRFLQPMGYDVTSYTDPVAALAAFRAAPGSFEAVVTDLSMPGMHGLELVRLLLETRPGMPIVATSGYVSDEEEAAALSAGARALILKPSTIDEFGRALDAALRKV